MDLSEGIELILIWIRGDSERIPDGVGMMYTRDQDQGEC